MPARKMRVDLFDSGGDRYTITFEGQITRDKAVRLLDLIELLGGVPNTTMEPNAHLDVGNDAFSKYARVRLITQKNFPLVWFSSREIQLAYEQECKGPISLSTTATYLSRLANQGLLIRTGPANSLKYKVTQNLPRAQIKQQTPE